MSDKPERAYWWIDHKAERAGRWLDKNIGRVLFAAGAAGLSIYGYRQPEGTFLNSISAELFGIVLTAVIIDYVNERRQEKLFKAQLIRQMGMNIRDVAIPAARELAHHGWLFDGSVSGADLGSADLSGANLQSANLSETYSEGANFSEADMYFSFLSEIRWLKTNLSEARLRGADLMYAQLQEANLREANLSDAFLNGADLTMANLAKANLSGAYLIESHLGRADLSGADLGEANLNGAYLGEANLSGARLKEAKMSRTYLGEANLSGAQYWTIGQLEQAKTLEGAIMPDGVQLEREESPFWERIKGPTFEEWKVQYLAEHGGTVTDIRGERVELDDTANG